MTASRGVGVREVGMHASTLAELLATATGPAQKDATFTYAFQTFFHPYVGDLIKTLNTGTLADAMNPDTLYSWTKDFFETFYTVGTAATATVAKSYPQKSIDVSVHGPYAAYNWEMLFHLPLGVAVHLSKNQRFAEARRWFHLIFDPTSTDPLVDPLKRFWKFVAFRYPDATGTLPLTLDQILVLLSTPPDELDSTTGPNQLTLLAGYADLMAHPFQPHAVARTRPQAYQHYVVMKYLDNLIAAGDQLFTQFTIESLSEATMYYVMAASILGERPQKVPPRGTIRPKSFAELNAPVVDASGQPVLQNGKQLRGVDAMGNALVDLEAQFPFNFMPSGDTASADGTLFGIGRTLYFAIPPNPKLLGYWDTVAERLFKIRHCMDIDGVVRQLPLFDPPLDPAMLVKAAAAGLDVGSIVSETSQPVSPVRCQILIQKALELASEVRSLGGALLVALEKGDAERLSLLRQDHEIALQQLTQDVKFLQWQQAQASTDTLLRTRDSALERYKYYLRLLGQDIDANAPDTLALDRRELTEDNFDDAFQALVGQYDLTIATQAFPKLTLANTSSPSIQAGATSAGSLYLNSNEDSELNFYMPVIGASRAAAAAFGLIGAVLTFIPEIDAKLAFWGLGAGAKIFGGSKMSDAMKINADVAQTAATWAQDQQSMAARTAGYQRRADDWMLQANLATRELMQIGRQILTSLIAEQVAHHDYKNIQTQVAQSQDVRQFLEDKFTSEELYGWMAGEVSRLYYEYYRLAIDTARKAERTMKRELMRPGVDATDYIQFNYWDVGRKGLLAGEALAYDIKRMELAYLDNNQRELEITRHVSLRQLDPLALISLKLTGSCEVSVPEWLYDLDCPGLYMRRIKTVALSLPSVVGPYSSLNCTLTLLRSSVRTQPDVSTGYARVGTDVDPRFIDYVGASEGIVTSSGNNDAGMFETNLRDERFLPFEGAGAISTWRLQLPKDVHAFDYATISDAILHVRYTARQGGDELASPATKALKAQIGPPTKSGLALLFWLRHDFPVEWSAFVNTTATTMSTTIKKSYFPYFVQDMDLTIDAFELYTTPGLPIVPTTSTTAATAAMSSTGSTTLVLDAVPHDATAQVFLVIRYSVS